MNGQSAAGKAVEDLLQTQGKDTCGCVRNAREKNANEERCRSKIGHEKQPGKMQHQNMTNELKFCGTQPLSSKTEGRDWHVGPRFPAVCRGERGGLKY